MPAKPGNSETAGAASNSDIGTYLLEVPDRKLESIKQSDFTDSQRTASPAAAPDAVDDPPDIDHLARVVELEGLLKKQKAEYESCLKSLALANDALDKSNKKVLKVEADHKQLAKLESERQERGSEEDRLSSLLNDLSSKQQEMWNALETSVVELSLECTFKMLRNAYSDEKTLRKLITAELQSLGPTPITVHVSQADCELLEDYDNSNVKFIADQRVELGGCMIDDGTALLDSRIETRLQNLSKALIDCRLEAQAGRRD